MTIVFKHVLLIEWCLYGQWLYDDLDIMTMVLEESLERRKLSNIHSFIAGEVSACVQAKL